MFAADSQMNARSCLLTKLYSHLNQLADTCLVKACERIVFEDTLVSVLLNDLACVIS